MQDVITQVKYNLPIINVVFSNDAFGFIEAEQEDTEQQKFGVFLEGADFGKVGEALGADGYTITEYSQLEPEKFSVEQINAFKEKYQVHDMPTLRELLK